MRDLRLGTVGRILRGEEAGRFVEVVDDFESTGGFLVITYGAADRSGQGFDSWVPSIVDVDLFFDESGWEVEWLDG